MVLEGWAFVWMEVAGAAAVIATASGVEHTVQESVALPAAVHGSVAYMDQQGWVAAADFQWHCCCCYCHVCASGDASWQKKVAVLTTGYGSGRRKVEGLMTDCGSGRRMVEVLTTGCEGDSKSAAAKDRLKATAEMRK